MSKDSDPRAARRVLFLDFDGVLHPTIPSGKHSTEGTVISVGFFGWLPALNQLLRGHSDLAIVVHSTWRYTHNEEELRGLLGVIGDRVIGVTPNGPRYESIQGWLNAHPNVQSYRVLDDEIEEYPTPPPPELIVCDPTSGAAEPQVMAQLKTWLQTPLPQVEAAGTQAMLAACRALCSRFPESLVVLGDLADRIHSPSGDRGCAITTGHLKLQLYIALCDLADLRDMEIVVPDHQDHKHTMQYAGFEFEIYSERNTALNIPHSEVFGGSEVLNGIRVANAKHMSMLQSRSGSESEVNIHAASSAPPLAKAAGENPNHPSYPDAEVLRYVFFPSKRLARADLAAAVSTAKALGATVVATSPRQMLVEAGPSVVEEIARQLKDWKYSLNQKVISFGGGNASSQRR